MTDDVYQRTRKWALAALESLPTMARYPGVDWLRGAFMAQPWVQVAPGPSLDAHVDELHRIKGRAVICALSHAVARLTDAGVVPDIVIGCEEADQRHYLDMADLSQTWLVLDAKVPPPMWDIECAGKFVYTSTSAAQWLNDAFGGDLRLLGGNTVASPALLLGRVLGCAPQVLVGHDLAYPRVDVDGDWGLQQYASGTPRSDWRDRLVRVPAVDGSESLTPQTFAKQLDWLDERAAEMLLVSVGAAWSARIPNAKQHHPVTGDPLDLATIAADYEDRDIVVDVPQVIGEALGGFDVGEQRKLARRWCIDVARDLDDAAKAMEPMARAAAAGKRAVWSMFHWSAERRLASRKVADGDLLAALVEAPEAHRLFQANLTAADLKRRAENDIALAAMVARVAEIVGPKLRGNAVELAR